MNDFDWQTFRAKLMLKKMTIKKWLKENNIDSDRYKNIRYKVVAPTLRETRLFKSVVEDCNG